jgi:hydroxymethylpyrimidine pyrophosphatase-like HAD family hydrolase
VASIVRALAIDYDGTISHHGRPPSADVLASLRRARDRGCRVLLVTGRIASELRADFPEIDRHVDAIVAENGSVIERAGASRALAPPVDPALAEALSAHSVPHRRGETLLACDGTYAVVVLRLIRELGLDCQLVSNRDSLMVLPAGVTKGSGLFEALGDLGISHHSTLGVGDAENDHALLDVCEIGVAVSNAVPALRRHADLVLDQPDGAGVASFLDGPLLTGERRVHSARWQLRLGNSPTGRPVWLPASQLNLLVCGDTGRGKSYTAGLVAERLIGLGYCVLVVDPEGDHRELVRLRGTVTVDAADGLPPPARLVDRFRQRFTSIVLDLSSLPPDQRREYLDGVAPHVADLRRDTGLPHWVVLDEAHDAPPGLISGELAPGDRFRGQCLATFRPGDLDPTVLADLDAVVALPGPVPLPDDVVEMCCRVSGVDERTLRHMAGGLDPHDALVAMDPALGTTTAVTLAVRATPQVRHEHKYGSTRTAPERWFYFRDGADRVVDVAGNMADLRSVLSGTEEDVLWHHAPRHDLSSWVAAVFQDPVLSAQLAEVERLLAEQRIDAGEARIRMLAAVTRRYPP